MTNLKNTAFKSALEFQARQLTHALEIIAHQKVLLNLTKSALPIEIATHVQHCVPAGKRLLVYTESPNWASQIRFFNEAILNKINTSGQLNITTLQVKIVQQFAEQPITRTASLPSAENINQISALAKVQGKPDELQTAFGRLANTLIKRAKLEVKN